MIRQTERQHAEAAAADDRPLPIVNVYADGACPNNGATATTHGRCTAVAGVGGYFGANDGRNFSMRIPADEAQTNNRAELWAVIQALRVQQSTEEGGNCQPACVCIWTDSSYVVTGMSEWMPRWRAAGWRRSGGGTILNLDLWLELERLVGERVRKVHEAYTNLAPSTAAATVGCAVVLKHIAGHAGDPGNEAADRLATRGAASSGPFLAGLPAATIAMVRDIEEAVGGRR